jgi:two-component system, cell cycle sensor histidine kinase and response regulator CckA
MASARILYLDDEEPLVFIVKRMLERLGHQVAGFTAADAALAAFTAEPDSFHLVLSDMGMPGMNGVDFAAAVLQVRPGALVVIVSGYMDPKDMERAKACGVRECIRKPNTIDEMKEMVAMLLPNL